MTVINHKLFSHTYLAQLQADSSNDEAAAPIAQGLRDWLPFRDGSSLQTLVDSWVGPVLDFLEFHHTPADGDLHIHQLYAQDSGDKPIGLCYVVALGEDLNDTIKGCQPMARAAMALRARDLRWGILTNGDQWRLLDAQALRRYEFYLEIDLDQMAAGDGLSPGRLFHACFHRTAFMPDGEGKPRLERLLEASAKATKAAEDHLKAAVSHNEGIMAQLCMGLVRATGKTSFTEAERDAIYRDATYLLYRMLFILYAEAEGLLPVDNPAYRAASLTELIKTAHEYKLHGMPDSQATTLWQRLKRLCSAIYESDPALDIPAYNGGLFDDSDKPYLGDSIIADAYLTPALFDLTYRPTSDGYLPIDYRDLSVRHLGSIYEGMIEYKLQIAEESLWARHDKKGTVRFLATGQEGAPRKNDLEIKPGDVYFSQSPGERRTTGTYYTPEYIVDYIISQTVWRGLAERRAPLEEKLTGWLEEIAAATDPAERGRMQRTADEELQRFVEEEVLAFRVCDPAMGSGHFLVNAAHQIANFIVETLGLTPWENIEVDVAPAVWRRRAVECCLYGVDLSLMAVELAKLSLWLASVAQGKPLSFLDHHLRHGNSLIGARLEDLATALAEPKTAASSRKEREAKEAGQLSMLDDPAFCQHLTAATDLLEQISDRVAETVQDVKAQEADYEQVRAELEPFRRVADVWVARQFGLELGERDLHDASTYIIDGTIGSIPRYKHKLEQAREIAAQRHFFHWDLEFPVQLVQGGGFDCSVGNPPWVSFGLRSAGTLEETEAEFYRLKYADSAEYKLSIYAVFIEAATCLVRWGGRQSFIVPDSILLGIYFKNVRRFILDNSAIERILFIVEDFWPSASVGRCVIYVQRRESRPAVRQHEVVEVVEAQTLLDCAQGTTRSNRYPQSAFEKAPLNRFRLFFDEHSRRIIEKMESVSNPLREIVRFYSGLIGKAGKASIVLDTKPADHSPERYGRLISSGRYLGRYCLEFTGQYIVRDKRLYKSGYDEEKYLAPKLLMNQTGDSLKVCYDDCGFFCLNNMHLGYLVATDWDLHFVNSILCSRLMNFYYQVISLEQGRAMAQIDIETVDVLPVPDLLPAPWCGASSSRFESISNECDWYISSLNSENLGEMCRTINRENAYDLLVLLAQRMLDFNRTRGRLEREGTLFHFIDREATLTRLDKALGGRLSPAEKIDQPEDPAAVHHDIEGLRLSQEEDGGWLLEARAKLRDPASGWREHLRDAGGSFLRQWLPVYRLPLDEATGRFYHYTFANLRGFDGAGKFPGGGTRTMLEKLHATKVPEFVPVDLTPLVEAEAELAVVRRKIQLTDDLIDQIVYRLYGLTEEEIAIVEGRA